MSEPSAKKAKTVDTRSALKVPTAVLQLVQTCLPLRERAVLPGVCGEYKNVVPLLPAEKKQYDALVQRYGSATYHGVSWPQAILGFSVMNNDPEAIPLLVSLGADLEKPAYRMWFTRMWCPDAESMDTRERAWEQLFVQTHSDRHRNRFEERTQCILYTAAQLAAGHDRRDVLVAILRFPTSVTMWRMWYLVRDSPNVITLLLDLGADPNMCTNVGGDDNPFDDPLTLCMEIAQNGPVSAMRALFEGSQKMGIPLNVQDYFVCQCPPPDDDPFLEGWDINDIDPEDHPKIPMTALDIAHEYSIEDGMVAYLRSIGGMTYDEVNADKIAFARGIVDDIVERVVAC